VSDAPPLKPVVWIASSLDDLKEFPDEVQGEFGYALHLAQQGQKSDSAKPLHGFTGASVVELVEAFDGNAYRCVYTVRFQSAVYVLHAFQKKSHKGGKTDPRDIDLVERRLKRAAEQETQRLKETKP
jgi:phage-related protein